MNTEGLIGFSLVLVWAFSLWAGVVFVVPWCLRSVFRNRLWRLRDQIVDDYLNAALPDDPVTHGLIIQVEDFIRIAREVTLLNFVSAGVLFGDNDQEELEEEKKRRHLTLEQRTILDERETELGVIVVRHLVEGSPSGWLFFTLGTVLVGIIAVLRGQTPAAFLRSKRDEMAQDVARSQQISRMRKDLGRSPIWQPV